MGRLFPFLLTELQIRIKSTQKFLTMLQHLRLQEGFTLFQDSLHVEYPFHSIKCPLSLINVPLKFFTCTVRNIYLAGENLCHKYPPSPYFPTSDLNLYNFWLPPSSLALSMADRTKHIERTVKLF